MSSVKKSIFFSDRLQLAIGPAGGFAAPGDPPLGKTSDMGLTRRVNTLGDRYQALMEDVAIENVLTREQLMRVGDVVGNPWPWPTFKIHDLGQMLAVANNVDIDDLESTAGRAAADYELIKLVQAMSFVQKIAVVEWIERNCVAQISVASQPAVIDYVLTPRRVLRAAAMGVIPSAFAARGAINQLIKGGFSPHQAPAAHICLNRLACKMVASESSLADALVEIGG